MKKCTREKGVVMCQLLLKAEYSEMLSDFSDVEFEW